VFGGVGAVVKEVRGLSQALQVVLFSMLQSKRGDSSWLLERWREVLGNGEEVM